MATGNRKREPSQVAMQPKWTGLRFIALEDAARGEPVRVEIDPPPPGVGGAQEIVEAAARAIVAEAAKQRKAGLLLDRLAAALALLDRERATLGG